MNTIFNIPFDADKAINHGLALLTVILFFYLFMCIGRHAAGKSRSKIQKEASHRAHQIIQMIEWAPNSTELSILQQVFEDFQFDYRPLIEREHFLTLSGEISAAISNRDAQINHRWYSLSAN